ncbi:MAG TPA: nuclear transport factor 2 family protein [Gammaproteobacteria bacterium]|nr:nuclear transport factor 2 family protein [Gammaproteobacteria bacterium]
MSFRRAFCAVVLSGATLVPTACDRPADQPAGGDPAVREALLEADRDFAAYAREHGARAAFERYLAADALLMPAGGKPERGLAGIARQFPEKERQDFTFDWRPEEAAVAVSGELGYTWGYWELRGTDGEGRPYARYGKYVSIWRREDGEWKVVLDIGNEGPEPGLAP